MLERKSKVREYDQEILEHVQACELSILHDFMEVCERYDLEWFALAGTVLGAVRHQGFIPWDDDIDVGLPAEDLEKLLEVMETEYSDKYVVMNAAHDIEYPLATTRLMLRGTEFREEPLKDMPCDLGIFLDIYALDAVPDDERAYRRQAWDAWFWSHVRILQSIPNPVILQRGWKGSAIRTICRAASTMLRVSGLSKERVFAKEQEARNRYRGQDTKRFAYLCDTNRFSTTFVRDEVLPAAKLPFCDVEINVPANYVEHLTVQFGDYMTLPPVEQRKNHFPFRLNFGSY